MGDAFIDIPEVVANTWTENPVYVDADSDYSRLMKDDSFWRRKTKEHAFLFLQKSHILPLPKATG